MTPEDFQAATIEFYCTIISFAAYQTLALGLIAGLLVFLCFKGFMK